MPSKIRLVCLGHQKGVGKDTLAKYLADKLGFTRVAFADKMKEVMADLFGLTFAQLNGEEKEIIHDYYEMTPRTMMQRFGTEAIRQKVWEKTWTDYLLKQKIPYLIEQGRTDFVITDLRFRLEWQEIMDFAKAGDVPVSLAMVKIIRPGLRRSDFHSSEVELEDARWQICLSNYSTPEKLYSNFLDMYETFQTAGEDKILPPYV